MIDNGEGPLFLVLVTIFVLNNFSSDNVFGMDYNDGIPYKNNVWPNDFEVSFEGVKIYVAEFNTNYLDFRPLSLCFKNKILAHMISTNLDPPTRFLSGISMSRPETTPL